MALPKYEGRFTVPTGGYSMTVTDSGGTQTVTVLAAGNYYLNAATSMLSAIGTALTANSTLAGTYTLTADDGSATSTGKITISATGGGNPSITWGSPTTLRDALGFTADLSGAASYTGASASPYLWLPNVKRTNPMAPDGYSGLPVTDASFVMAPTGTSKVLQYATRYKDNMEHRWLLGNKTWIQHESVTNESLEKFYTTVMATGAPFAYFLDRSDDAHYVYLRSTNPGEFTVAPELASFVGDRSAGAATYWHFGPLAVIKFV